jgi:hypothetical protein
MAACAYDRRAGTQTDRVGLFTPASPTCGFRAVQVLPAAWNPTRSARISPGRTARANQGGSSHRGAGRVGELEAGELPFRFVINTVVRMFRMAGH